MEAASEPEVTGKVCGDAPASERCTKKSKPPPADIAAQRAVKAKGSAKTSKPEPPSKSGSRGDPPAVPADVEMGEVAQMEASGAPPAAAAASEVPVAAETRPTRSTSVVEEPEILVASAPMPRMLENPIPPCRRLRP